MELTHRFSAFLFGAWTQKNEWGDKYQSVFYKYSRGAARASLDGWYVLRRGFAGVRIYSNTGRVSYG